MTALIVILTCILWLEITFGIGVPAAGFVFLGWFFLIGTYGCSWYNTIKEKHGKCVEGRSIALWFGTAVGWNYCFSSSVSEVIMGIFVMLICISLNYILIDKNKELTGSEKVQKLMVNGFLIVMVVAAFVTLIAPFLNRKEK